MFSGRCNFDRYYDPPENLDECHGCGRMSDEGDEVDGKFFCIACVESGDYVKECGICETLILVDDGDFCANCLESMEEEEESEDDCPMDGDDESALGSCGCGVDEDYGGGYGTEYW